MPRIFHVSAEEAEQTLSAQLRRWLPGQPPWSEVRRLILSRHVQVNGNLCLDAGRRLKPRDVVHVLEHPGAPPAREDDVRIRFLDAHLVVIEKPSGMTSVRHAEERFWPAKRKQAQPTLEDLLPRVIAKKLGGSRGHVSRSRRMADAKKPARTPPVRPVHRLDRDTSGLMVFARTVPAERHLGLQFRQHVTGRRYLAVVQGSISAQTIETQLVRDRGDGRRGSTNEPNVGKRAVTHVRPLESLGDYTLVECRLETGRTHQIRIHLSEHGHPVCGDKVYQQPMFKPEHVDRSGAPRLALHATELEFEHPVTGQRLHFDMELPQDLELFVARLRAKALKGDSKAR
jgi:23S rRNA pseudouridine1911/1915/1917 synthase